MILKVAIFLVKILELLCKFKTNIANSRIFDEKLKMRHFS